MVGPRMDSSPLPWYVYLALLSDGRYYVGISRQELQNLLAEHKNGDHSRFTRAEGLRRIVWTEPHSSLSDAMRREKQLKRWTHAKKQALIDGDMDRLKSLARSKGKGRHGRP